MHGSGAVSCSCSLLIRGPNLPAVRQKLHLSPCADSRSRLLASSVETNVTDLIERLASRSQIKHGYGSHRQQPQNHGQSDVLDPFLIVREPSMMHVHGQPPSGYPCSKLTYHIYGSMTECEPVVYLCKRQSCRNAMNRNDYSNCGLLVINLIASSEIVLANQYGAPRLALA